MAALTHAEQQRLRRLLRHANYPRLLPKTVEVVFAPNPRYPRFPTTDPGPPITVFWFGRDVPYDFLHEYAGHALDFELLTDDDRADPWLRRCLNVPLHRPWFWDRDPAIRTRKPDPVCEPFADACSLMQLHPANKVRLRHYLRRKLEDAGRY